MPNDHNIIDLSLVQGQHKEEVVAEILRLAKLSPVEYELQRNDASDETGLRLSILDRLVESERRKLPKPDDPSFDRSPDLETVVGAELVNGLIKDLTTYVSLDADYAVVAAFWVIHTYLLDYGASLRITPRLAITAPEKRCGKTTFIDWLSTVVQRPKRSDNISAAAVYRVVEKLHPTLLIDEADTYLDTNDQLRGILNSGHRSDGSVDRCDRDGNILSFSTYAACAISLIGGLPGTLQDRSIRIRLRRRRPDEKIASFRNDRTEDCFGRMCARWALDCRDAYSKADPTIPPELFSRVEDNWRPLLAIADVIGRDWPERLRTIAVKIAQLEAGENPSEGARLLADIREIFGDRDWITSGALISKLHSREWIMSPKSLANKLKPYGIEPRQERFGNSVERGYCASSFSDAFSRYLTVPLVPLVPEPEQPDDKPPAGNEPAGTSGTSGTTNKPALTSIDLRKHHRCQNENHLQLDQCPLAGRHKVLTPTC
jgi:putative DNA primase/helicase